MSIHYKQASGKDSLLGAWHAQVAETAVQTPWLVQELLRRKSELLPKFAAYYQHLRALPRRTRRMLQRKLAPSLAGAALLLALGQGQAIAATINVGGGCSLIDAITAADTDTATGGCTAGSGADTISLPASSTHTLTAINNDTYDPTGLPVIRTTITIEGNGSTITRDSGAADFRIVAIAGSGKLILQETTLSGGVTANFGRGGGVFNLGSLTLTDSTISGNSAYDGGGGVYNGGGTVTLSNSTITRNTGINGGGVWNYSGTATLSNSTISGNTAYSGGGVSNIYGTVTLSNSTITGNTAHNNGGGVYNGDGTVTLSRTIITGNTADLGGAEVSNFAGGAITANNFNLFGHDGLTNAQAFFDLSPGVTDLTATSDGGNPTALTAILDTTLQDNGGPTLTHALVTGSPAIDASPADADCEPTDQRGVSRPQGAACDIGAFEFEGGVAIVSGGTRDNPAPASLVQDAINAASAGGAIEVSGFFSGCIVVNKRLTLIEGGGSSAKFTSDGCSPVIEVSADGATVKDITVDPAAVGILVSGNNNTVQDMDVFDNDTGIEVTGANNTITKNTVEGSAVAAILVSGPNNTVNENRVMENSDGIVVQSDGNTVSKNKVGDKDQVNDGHGIAITGNANEVKENQIFANTEVGIWVDGDGNSFLKNKVGEKGKGNSGAGVWVAGNHNTLTENDVFANGGDGIAVNGNGNVLKKNDVGDKGKGNGGNGIVVTGGGNGEPDPVEIEENKVKGNAQAGIVINGAGHELKKNQSGGKDSGVTNGGCEYVIAAGNLDKQDNKADDAKFSFGSGGVVCGGSF